MEFGEILGEFGNLLLFFFFFVFLFMPRIEEEY